MQELVDAERPPERSVFGRKPHTLDDLLLRPVDMIMDDEFAGENLHGEHGSGIDEQKQERRAEYVQSSVQNPAGMAVDSLILVLVRRLQEKIENEMFNQEDQDSGQRNVNRIGHGIAPVLTFTFRWR